MEEFYSAKFHIKDIEMSLGFDRETIRLSIPRSGVILQSGWKVKARYDPVVSHKICFPCACSICSSGRTCAITSGS